MGNTIAPASFYGPGSAYDDRASAWATSDAWMTSLAANAPRARTFLYMPDEPGPSQYAVYFYWHADHWRHNFQKQGERDQDVWASSVTFDNRGQPNKPIADQGFIHGDGVLLYPGEEVLHPAQDRGIAGPVGTLQLANLRRGLQDHLYLTLARQRGLDEAVTAALASVVPAVFSEAGATVRFAQTGDAYEHARYQLARALGGRR